MVRFGCCRERASEEGLAWLSLIIITTISTNDKDDTSANRNNTHCSSTPRRSNNNRLSPNTGIHQDDEGRRRQHCKSNGRDVDHPPPTLVLGDLRKEPRKVCLGRTARDSGHLSARLRRRSLRRNGNIGAECGGGWEGRARKGRRKRSVGTRA